MVRQTLKRGWKKIMTAPRPPGIAASPAHGLLVLSSAAALRLPPAAPGSGSAAPRGTAAVVVLVGFPKWRKFPFIWQGNILLRVFQQNTKNPARVFFSNHSHSLTASHSPSPARDSSERPLLLPPRCWLLFSCLINYLPS